jgi:thiazole synthase
MEMGAAACLVNTAIASSADPIGMAKAFGEAVTAGRKAHLSGIGPEGVRASASSPLTGFLHEKN